MQHPETCLPGALSCTRSVQIIRTATRAVALIFVLFAAPSAYAQAIAVSVDATDDTANESPGDSGQFTIRRRGPALLPITVSYSIEGSATPGDDYEALSGVAVIPPLSTSTTIDVTPLDDDVEEGVETVQITLSSSDNGSEIRPPAMATVSIMDNDPPDGDGGGDDGSGDGDGDGDDGGDGGGDGDSGGDGNGDDGGDDGGDGDGDGDGDGGGDGDGDDGGNGGGGNEVQVSVFASDDTASEASSDNGEFVVRRVGGNASRPVTIRYSVGGSASPGDDYDRLAGTVRLGAQETEATIALAVGGNDNVFEGNENVTIALQDDDDVVVMERSASITIRDSSHSVSAERTSNATENPVGAGEITVSLGARNESGRDLVVDYSVGGTATAGVDYEPLSGTTTIRTGSSSASITVTPLDDNLREPDETVEISLTGTSNPAAPPGSPSSATLSIVDDDAPGDDDGDGVSNLDECPAQDDCPDTDGDGLTDDQDADDDGDGIPTTGENPPNQDTDDDGIADYLDDDDDGDGRLTSGEDANEDGDGNPATNPSDLDGDGIPDYLDARDTGGPEGDVDGDGLSNEREEELGTDPQVADTDGDGVNDGDEDSAGTDPLDERSFADADGDLVPDAVEAADGTNENDPRSFTDGDRGGTADYIETTTFATFGLPATDPGDASDDQRDFDGDGLPDRLEISRGTDPVSAGSPTANGGADDSGNGITNALEAYLAELRISPVDTVSDHDRDGYPDAREVALGLDPLSAREPDSDGDGVPDVVEVLAGIDIDAATDSDGDGVPDAREIALGADPLDANSPIANGSLDDDGNGASNAIDHVLELLNGSGETDAGGDSDGDGIMNADEIRLGTDPSRDEQPAIWIELAQAEIGAVNGFLTDGGAATATAAIGGHQTGVLIYDWSESDNAILAVSSGVLTNRTLEIAPQTLPPGPYDLVLNVQRTAGDYSSPVSTLRVPINVLSDAGAAQVADADQDGVLDGSDNADARLGFANELEAQSTARLQVANGIRLQLGSTARIARAGSARVTTSDIASAGDGSGSTVGNSEDDFDYLGGIYDFEATNLPEVGSGVSIVIPQATAIGEFPVYRKFRPGPGWADFVEDANNSIESAAGSSGSCPPPGDDSYQSGLTPGHFCIQLTIEDGGPNDGDAELGPNGVIKDPGGVATPKGEVSAGQGGGSTGFPPLIVLGVFAAATRLLRRNRANQYRATARPAG